jgi:hypothetical protein
MVREPDAATRPAPQDNQLMSKHRVLSFETCLRLEWRSQDGQSEPEQPDHSASLGDSITASHPDEVFGTHSIANRDEALERAERLRPVLAALAGLSPAKIAAELNARNIATPTGARWHAATVRRIQARLLEAMNEAAEGDCQ